MLVAMCVPTASAAAEDFVFDDENQVYFANSNRNVLYRVGETGHVYSGYVAAKEAYKMPLRFFTSWSDRNNNRINVISDENQYDVHHGDAALEFSCEKSGRSVFAYLDDTSGIYAVTVDIDNMTASIKLLAVENVYFTSPDVAGAETAPNAISLDNVAAEGDIAYSLVAQCNDGSMVNFAVQGAFNCEDQTGSGNILFGADKTARILGCTPDNPIKIIPDFNDGTVKFQLANLDMTTLLFEWRINQVYRSNNNYYTYNTLYYDSNFFEEDDIEITFPDWVTVEGGRFRVEVDEPTKATVTAYNKKSGVTISTEMTFIPLFPAGYCVYDRSSNSPYPGLTLAKEDDVPYSYAGRITIPEGEGTFNFMFCGTGEYAGEYRVRPYDITTVVDLADGYFRGQVTEGSGQWEIPAEYRGATFNFWLNMNSGMLDIYTDEHGLPADLEWNEDFQGYIRQGSSLVIWDLVKYTGAFVSQDLRFDFEPSNRGLLHSGELIESWTGDDIEPGPVTVTVTTPSGYSISKEFMVHPRYADSYSLYTGDGVRMDNMDINLLSGNSVIRTYEGMISIPASESAFEFGIDSSELPGIYGIYPEGCVNTAVPGLDGKYTVLQTEETDWSGTSPTWYIPQQFTGKTYRFRLNTYGGAPQLSIFAEGFDPDKIEVIPDESNPTVQVSESTTRFSFTVKGVDLFNWPEIRSTSGWSNNVIYEEIETGVYRLAIDMYTYERDVENTISIVMMRNGEEVTIYEFIVPVKLIIPESVDVPALLTIRKGEFVECIVSKNPSNASGSIWGNVDMSDGEVCTAYNYTATDDGNMVFHIVGIKEGSSAIDWFSNYVGTVGRTKVEVLPADAVLADHMFHAHLKVGDSLPLFVEFADRAGDDIAWSSSDPEIASVESDGTVTGHGDGTAVLTAVKGDSKAMIGVRVGDYTTSVENAVRSDVRVYGHDGTVYVTGASDGAEIRVFDPAGHTVAVSHATEDATVRIGVGRGVRLITVGEEVFKLAL